MVLRRGSRLSHFHPQLFPNPLGEFIRVYASLSESPLNFDSPKPAWERGALLRVQNRFGLIGRALAPEKKIYPIPGGPKRTESDLAPGASRPMPEFNCQRSRAFQHLKSQICALKSFPPVPVPFRASTLNSQPSTVGKDFTPIPPFVKSSLTSSRYAIIQPSENDDK
jgi:hypothetical protein